MPGWFVVRALRLTMTNNNEGANVTVKFCKVSDIGYEVRVDGVLYGIVVKYRHSTPLMTNDAGLHYSYGSVQSTLWKFHTDRKYLTLLTSDDYDANGSGYQTRNEAARALTRAVKRLAWLD